MGEATSDYSVHAINPAIAVVLGFWGFVVALPVRVCVVKLIVFGATGVLGSRLVDEALRRGHQVTGVARDPSRLGERGGEITAVSAYATQADSVAQVARGYDAAVSAITQHQRPEVLVDAARGLLDGLARAGVARLVVAGGAGSLKVPSGERLMDTPGFHEEWKPEAQAQALALATAGSRWRTLRSRCSTRSKTQDTHARVSPSRTEDADH